LIDANLFHGELKDENRDGDTGTGFYDVFACLVRTPASSTFLATRNQSAVLFSHNKLAPAISHQPNEQAVNYYSFYRTGLTGPVRSKIG
jgi:hypothetical protein